MRNLMNDIVAVIQNDGTKHEGVRASVGPEEIIVDDVTIPISVGDRIERNLPSGQQETFVVTKVHMYRGSHGIPDFYEITYESEGLRTHRPELPSVSVQVTSSPQTRVTLNSTDQSTNVINHQAEDVFKQIRDLLKESIADETALSVLLEKVEDLERSRDSEDFKGAYKDFVAAAANHMTVLAPVLPMLAAML